MGQETKKKLKTYFAILVVCSVVTTLTAMLLIISFSMTDGPFRSFPITKLIISSWNNIIYSGLMLIVIFAPIGMWHITVRQKWPDIESNDQVELRNKILKLQTSMKAYAAIGIYGIISLISIFHMSLLKIGDLLELLFSEAIGWEILAAVIIGKWGYFQSKQKLELLQSSAPKASEVSCSSDNIKSEKTKKQLKAYYAVFAGMSLISILVLLAWYFYLDESGGVIALKSIVKTIAKTILFGWSTTFNATMMAMALFAPIGLWNISVKQKWLEEDSEKNLNPQQAEFRSKKLKLQTIMASYVVISAYGFSSYMAVWIMNTTTVDELIVRIFSSFQGWIMVIAYIGGAWGYFYTKEQQKELESSRNSSQESSPSAQVDLDK